MNRACASFVWLFLLPMAIAQGPGPVDRLLSLVPDDTAVVIALPDVQKAVAGLTAFRNSVGVEKGDELDARRLLEEIDLLDKVEGLDLGGPLVLAFAPFRNGPLLLCAVKDAEAWRRATEAEEVEGGLLRVHVFGERRFAAIADGRLVLDDDREAVEAARRAEGTFARRVGAQAGGLLTTHDVVVYVDVPPWRPVIDVALKAMGALGAHAGMSPGAAPDQSMAEMVGWALGEASRLLREIQVVTLAVRLRAEGLHAEAAVLFRPDGPVAAYLKDVRASKAGLLRGLPAGEIMMVLAGEWESPPGTKSLNTWWVEGMLSMEALKERFGGAAFEQAMKASIAAYEATTGSNLALTPAPAAKGLLFTSLYFTRDPQAVIKHTRTAYEVCPRYVNLFGPGSTMDLACRDERIDSTSVCMFEMSFKTEDEQARRMLEGVYGQSITGFMGPHAEGTVLAMGPAEAARSQIKRLLAGAGGKLSEDRRVLAAGRALAPEPQVLVLVDLPRMVAFFISAARETGLPVPSVKFAETPSALVAVGAYLKPDRIRAELTLPAEPVEVLITGFRGLKETDGER